MLILFAAVKVAREYERGVIFRLGRLLPQPKGPGLFILIPVIDRMVKVDLRTVTLNVPPQEVITKDNVPVRVNAVAYFRIVEPKAAIVQVENLHGRDVADLADDAALGARPARARRAAVGARQDQRDPPGDHRRSDPSVGDQGLDRRGEGCRDPVRHAARDGAPGGGGARAAREGDRRRGEFQVLKRRHQELMTYRRALGFCPQTQNLDTFLTVKENLIFAGRYFLMPEKEIKIRIAAINGAA